MKPELKTAQIREIRKSILSYYDREDKKGKRNSNNVQFKKSSTLIVSPETIQTLGENVEGSERVGRMFDTRSVYPPHEYFHESSVKASKLDGSESEFFQSTKSSRSEDNWLNFSLVLGQLFNTVYKGNSSIPSLSYFSTGGSSSFGDIIQFSTPFDRNIFVKSKINVLLPDIKNQWFYLDRGNLDIAEIGIEAYLQTHLACRPNNGKSIQTQKFHKFLDVFDSDENHHEFYEQSVFTVENFLKIPAGVSEFTFSVGIRGNIYSTKDFSNFSSLESDKYGFALLDLRHTIYGKKTPILSDPLGAWQKQPSGGVLLFIELEFYEAEPL